MAHHARASSASHEHGDVADLECLALRSLDGKGDVAFRVVVFGLGPTAAEDVVSLRLAVVVGGGSSGPGCCPRLQRCIVLHRHAAPLLVEGGDGAFGGAIGTGEQWPEGFDGCAVSQVDGVGRKGHLDALSIGTCRDDAGEGANRGKRHAGIEVLDQRPVHVFDVERRRPGLLVGREFHALRAREMDGSCLGRQSESVQGQFLGQRLAFVSLPHVGLFGRDGEVGGHVDGVGQYALLLHQLGAETSHEQGACGVEVGGTLAVEQLFVAFGVAITLVERGGGAGQVDKLHALLLGELLHVVDVVHGVVGGGQALLLLDAVGGEQREGVAQVVAAVTANLAIGEITAADGSHEHGDGALGLHLVHHLAQPLLVSDRGSGATRFNSVGLGGHALGDVVVVEFIAVHALYLLVVVGELDEHVVARLDVWFCVLPEFLVAAARVATALCIVHRCPAIGEEQTEIHAPSTRHGGRFGVVGHCGVADGVHFLRTDGAEACQ